MADLRSQTLDVVDLIVAYVGVVLDVLLQRWRMRKLPGLGSIGDLLPKGATVVVTGPTSGIGTETAAEFARRGCHVVLACRSLSRGKAVQEAIVKEAKLAGVKEPQTELMELDLASLDSVRRFCDNWDRQGRLIHILVNNAGVFAMGAPRSVTADRMELHLGTNYLSSFLLTMRLLPYLRKAGEELRETGSSFEARMVMVSSKLHELGAINIKDPNLTIKYSPTMAYGQSKLAQVMFVAELRRRIPGSWNVGCYSIHPGNVMTEVVRTLPLIIQKAYRIVMQKLLLTVSEGSRATLYAATSNSAKAEAEASSGYFDSDCVAKKPSSYATDKLMALWLWRFSSRSVALPASFDIHPRE